MYRLITLSGTYMLKKDDKINPSEELKKVSTKEDFPFVGECQSKEEFEKLLNFSYKDKIKPFH